MKNGIVRSKGDRFKGLDFKVHFVVLVRYLLGWTLSNITS